MASAALCAEAGIDSVELQTAWIRFADESVVETRSVPRAILDDIGAARKDWQALRDELGAGSFVDVTRLLVEPEAVQPEGASLH